MIDVSALFISFLPKNLITIATEAIITACNIGKSDYLNDLLAQFNAYVDAVEIMLCNNVLYYDVKQKYTYVVHGSDGGWIMKGVPTFTSHYQDY